MGNELTTTEDLWEHFEGILRRFLLKRVSDEQVAEDLLQETFIRIHRQIKEVGKLKNISSWVQRIARNLVVDHYRSKAHKVGPLVDDVAIGSHEEENLNELVMEWLPQMISNLPGSYRTAVELYELEGIAQQEIADQLGLSLSGAKSRIQRGREKLKSLLFDCCSFEKDRRGNVIGFRRNHISQECDACD